MFRILIAGVLLLALAGAAHGASPSFSARVTNPWFPLQPGSRYVYTGMKDGQPTRELMTVTHHVTTIGGAPCVAVDMPAQPHKGQSFRQELRLYVRGVGTVVEQTERGGSERNELVSFTVP